MSDHAILLAARLMARAIILAAGVVSDAPMRTDRAITRLEEFEKARL